jgi:hypothetical protein
MRADHVRTGDDDWCAGCDMLDSNGGGEATAAVIVLSVGEFWMGTYARVALCRGCLERMRGLVGEAITSADRRAAEARAR